MQPGCQPGFLYSDSSDAHARLSAGLRGSFPFKNMSTSVKRAIPIYTAFHKRFYILPINLNNGYLKLLKYSLFDYPVKFKKKRPLQEMTYLSC